MDAILTFHSIDESGSVLSFAPDDLRRLLEGLLAEGVSFVDPGELLEPPAGADPLPHRVALTFDDGIVSVHREAAPLLAEFGVPAVLYPVSDWVGRTNAWPGQPADAPRFELMSWDTLRELVAAGMTIGCHTANHPHLADGAVVDWERELDASRARLEDELGVEVRHFAYPYGTHGDDAVAQVAPRFTTAVTTELGYLPSADSGRLPHRLPRLDTYYLRDPDRRLPLFGAATRRYLAARGVARRLRGLFSRP